MRASIRLGVLAFLALPCLLLAQQRPLVTLAEAIRLAEQAQPSVVAALGGVRSADARIRTARAAALPNLTASASGGDFYSEGPDRVDSRTGQVVKGNTTSRTVNGSLSSSIDLFTGFRIGAEKESAKANGTAAQASYQNARYQQELVTTNQFFDVLSANQLLRVREASVRRAEEQLKVAINRLRTGAGTRSDSLRSLVTLGNAQLQLVNAKTQQATAEANLGRLIGRSVRVGAQDDSNFYQTGVQLDTVALLEEALSRSPQVQAALASAASARASIGVVKAAYWPTLSLGGSIAGNGSRSLDYTIYQQRQLNLSLNWPIFNRFTREQNIANQEVAVDNALATAEDVKRVVIAALTQHLAELDAAKERIDITRTSVVAATEDLRVQQERYRLGVATIVDLLTSQEALGQAEVDGVNARFDYLRARAQIQALIGRSL